MEPNLEFFLQRIREGWWVNCDAETLSQYVTETYERICKLQKKDTISARTPIKVLIVDTDRMRFAGYFLGAVAAGATVFLGNAHWNDKEWKDVAAILQPDLILGSDSELLRNSYQWTDACPLNYSSIIRHPILIPTGGSSEKVRFVWQSWEHCVCAVEGLKQFLKRDVIHSINPLELHHIGGLMPLVRTLITGGKYYDANWKDIEAGNLPETGSIAYNLSLVPTQLERCVHQPTIAAWLKSLDAIFIGGAATHPELLQHARTLQLPLILVYGMTETAAMICAYPGFLKSKSTESEYIGEALPHALFIRESNNRDRKHEASWEPIIIKAESLFYGYYPETPCKKEFFETSDEGMFSSNGLLQKVRRRDGVIISGGKKVAPGEIEELLKSERLVKDVCVLGIPSTEWGEEVVAVYVAADESKLHEDELKQFLKKKLEAHKIPKQWLRLESIPLNKQHKIDKKALREMFLAKEIGI